jgi:hypothetical protein
MCPLERTHRWLRTAWRVLRFLVILTGVLFLLGGSVMPPGGLSSQVHALTRPIEFDYGTWTLDAIFAKATSWGLNLQRFIPAERQTELVIQYLQQVQLVRYINTEIMIIYADPEVDDPEAASGDLREELEKAETRLTELAPLAESILQAQLMDVLEDAGLDVLGQALPPSLFQFSDVPQSLIVSPRAEIRTVLDISLEDGLSVDEMENLEDQVFNAFDYSALVVNIGGIGTYPTMVMQTTDIVWLTEVIAHEWTHNFLTLRPLGINYYTSSDLRTINETTASLAGKEIGLLILQKYYPDYIPEEVDEAVVEETVDKALPTPAADIFNFQTEMRDTRVEVDRLLAEGEVDAAETYMELRRQVFWENGYAIRKLNQAYFAFHGAYSDDPGGGAAGEDPVGPAVQAYRVKFESLADFLNSISWVDSYEDLLDLLEE